jgi:flagellar FliL protein
MAADTLDAAVSEMTSELPRRKMSGRTLVLYVILPLLVLSGGGAALFVTGALDTLFAAAPEPAEAEEAPPAPGAFYDLPDILVNLSGSDGRQAYLQISVSLELEPGADIDALEQMLPRIIDNFQVYLRELRLADLRGSAGLYRLREELLRRVHTAAAPVQVRDILFREMLVQQ